MERPTILVAEEEPAAALSTRKLVLETGKFNVLTAHSTDEAIVLFQKFPKVEAVVIAESEATKCDQIAEFIMAQTEKPPIIALSPREGYVCRAANYRLSSHDPEALLHLLRSLFGDPRELDMPAIKRA